MSNMSKNLELRLAASPTANLGSYITAANSIPMLTAEEEYALAVDLRENENIEAARQLILAHLRFVVHVAAATAVMACSRLTLSRKAISA
jgi:RNA polymerase sigma-32 factor